MATERLRTVKSAGGDYASLNAWEAGEQANIVTADEIRVAECYAFSDTTSTTLSGWTTDATRYMKITAPVGQRHAGIWSTSAYRLEVTNNFALSYGEEYIRAEYLQISITANNSTSYQALKADSSIAAGGSDLRIEQIIFRQDPGNTGTGSFRGVSIIDADATVRIGNCLFYDFTSGSGRGLIIDNATAVYAYNCGAHNCDVGIGRSGGTLIAKNCWAQNCTDGFSGTFDAASDYNLSDQAADAPGTHSKNSTSITHVNEAGDDFHLDSGDTAAKDSGTDLSADGSYPISVDIDGATRSGTWDIGPDEITAAGDQAITDAGAIATAAEFGTAVLTLSIAPTGIPSDEAFGTPALSVGAVTISPSGIASAEAFGTAVVFGDQFVTDAGGIGSAEAFGDHVITPGTVTLLPLGIGSLEAFGSPTVEGGDKFITGAGGIESGEGFGTPTLTGGTAGKKQGPRRRAGIGPR